ncbi:transcription termination/antitermination NusG family protein [Shinella kummerowiae]|uniref:transcription termination/antitermination NusG family protein n=1 Tax=Shinella kummerowiae TaxID=417745 RepID=UPI0021B63413|nr:transcription termination/antitermination NusG family protein [Shinella kummerowiae]MCT7665684.1 transcription termination/antitermination NusG family protein [Shinella kummerowiae]
MQSNQETVTVVDVAAGYVVVAPDSMAGWRVVEDGFTVDRSYAAIRAAGIANARVLPAMQERQEVGFVTTDTRTRFAVNVDWNALSLAGRRDENWYAVRVAPAAQRTAKAIVVSEYATDREKAEADRRKGESIVERQLRQKGIDPYMPAFWEEIRAHRGHKMRARRLPLFPGYAFIRHDPRKGFKPVKEGVEGVIDFVCVKQRPVTFSEDDIRFLMIQMFDREQAFRFQKAQRVEEARFKRRQTLNAELGRHLPRGRGRTVSLRAYADACINSLPAASKKRILGIMSALDGLEEECGLVDFREPV